MRKIGKITNEELASLFYEIDVLLVEFHSIDTDNEWKDDSKIWVKLDRLAGLKTQLLCDHFQMDFIQFQIVFKKALHLHKELTGYLDALKIFSPELFQKRKEIFLVNVRPATNILGISTPKEMISINNRVFSEKIITFCSYLFPKKFREEAKGDIFETRHEMFENGSSKIAVNFVTVFKIVSLILGSLRIRLSDLVKTENEINK